MLCQKTNCFSKDNMSISIHGDNDFPMFAGSSDYIVPLADGICYKLLFINKIVIDEMSPYVCIVYIM